MKTLFSRIGDFFISLNQKRRKFRRQHFAGVVKRYKKLHRRKQVGIGTYWGSGCHIAHRDTEIGKFCSIANGVHIGTTQHPTNFLSTHPFQYMDFYGLPGEIPEEKRVPFTHARPSRIGNDVWIGLNVLIMDGVNVGDGAIIAANAVVTKDIPPYAIAGGVPAKIIKYRFPDEVIRELLELRWWDLPLEQIQELPFHDISACIRAIRQYRERNSAGGSL